MKSYKRVLTIAGSDSGGGAGIQADIKTISAIGCYATSALTAVTVQNTVGVSAVHNLPISIVRGQIDAVLSDIGADAVKIGMLSSAEIVVVVADALKAHGAQNIVLDPVLIATSGDALSGSDTAAAIIEHLLPIATVVTPNIYEAEQITGMEYDGCNGEQLWRKFEQLGSQAVLLKGGHAPKDNTVTDTLFTPHSTTAFTSPYYNTPNTHGTGCTLSSAVASYLALGFDLQNATEKATAYIHHAIAAAQDYTIGKGHGPVMHFFKYWNNQ